MSIDPFTPLVARPRHLPSADARINTVLNFWDNPCDVPYYILLQTALPPLGRLAYRLLTFDVRQIVATQVRPASVRSQRRWRAGSRSKVGKAGEKARRGLGKIGIPDASEKLGKALPTSGFLNISNYPKGTMTLMVISDITLIGLYYFLVYDLITEFAYDWVSNIMDSTCAGRLQNPGFGGSGSGQIVLGVSGFQAASMPTTDWQRGGATWSGFSGDVPFRSYQIAYGSTIRNTHPTLTNQFEVRIRFSNPLLPTMTTGPIFVPPGGVNSNIVVGTFLGPTDVLPEIATFFGNAEVLEQNIFCTAISD